MRTAMRPRYYCEHCNKGNGSPSAMRRHERGCTLNPQRVCGMCKMRSDKGGPIAPPRDELVRIMDTEGFAAMCKAAEDCPACILAAVRTKNFRGDAETPPGVIGPEDGRESWNYAQAKRAWWQEWNTSNYDYPGY